MMSVPRNLVPPEFLPKMNTRGADADSDEDEDDGFASRQQVRETVDRVRVLETRIKRLNTFVVSAKKQPELQEKLGRMKAGVSGLQEKHQELRQKVRDEIKAFNQKKEERIRQDVAKMDKHHEQMEKRQQKKGGK